MSRVTIESRETLPLEPDQRFTLPALPYRLRQSFAILGIGVNLLIGYSAVAHGHDLIVNDPNVLLPYKPTLTEVLTDRLSGRFNSTHPYLDSFYLDLATTVVSASLLTANWWNLSRISDEDD